MELKLLSKKRLTACYIVTLLCLVITAGLFAMLCSQLTPALSRNRKALDFSVCQNDALIFNDRLQRLSSLPTNLVLTVVNNEPYTLNFVFSSLQPFSLDPGESVEISAADTDVFQVEACAQTTYYVSSPEGLREALNKQSGTLDNVVLLQDIHLSEDLSFSRSCRIDLGPFQLTGNGALILESRDPVQVSLISQRENAVFFTANAPKAKLYCTPNTLSFPVQTYDFYLKAQSINGSDLQADRYPIENEQMLGELSQAGVLSPGATLIFTHSFSLTRDHCFSTLPHLIFEEAPDFNGHRLCFESDSQTTATISTQEVIDATGLLVNAPFASVIWKGEGVPDIKSFSLTSQVLNYNQQDTKPYQLGGHTQARVVKMTLRHKDLIAPVEYTLQGNVFQGKLHTLDSLQILKNGFLEVECEYGSFALETGAQNPDSTVDLSQSPLCTLTDNEGNTARYRIQTLRDYLDLPVIEIHTQNGAPVTSKKDYINATFDLIPNGADVEGMTNIPVQIRGRGNSTWNWEKKAL